MEKKTAVTVFVSVLLLSPILGAGLTMPVNAPALHDVYPGESIQEAVNSAQPGDMIFVHAGVYYEHVFVNRTVSLIGEDPFTTVIDGNEIGIVVRVQASRAELRDFTIQNGGNTTIDCGIYVANSTGTEISSNIISDNAHGIQLFKSNNTSISDNRITRSSWASVHIRDSSNNEIYENTVTENPIGVWVTSPSSLNNSFYHNNFIDNLNQVNDFGSSKWDNGCEGNYWSDYNGEDLDGDGVGDTLLPHQGVDNYPLMNLYMEGDVNHDAIVDIVDIVIVAMSFQSTPEDPNWNCHADLNQDKLIDIVDIAIVATHFRRTDPDVNGDGIVDIVDVVIVALAFGSEPGDPNWDPRADIAEPWNLIDIVDVVLVAVHSGEGS